MAGAADFYLVGNVRGGGGFVAMVARAEIPVGAAIRAGGIGMPGDDVNLLRRGFGRKRREHRDTSGDLYDHRLWNFHIGPDYPDTHSKTNAGRAAVETTGQANS